MCRAGPSACCGESGVAAEMSDTMCHQITAIVAAAAPVSTSRPTIGSVKRPFSSRVHEISISGQRRRTSGSSAMYIKPAISAQNVACATCHDVMIHSLTNVIE